MRSVRTALAGLVLAGGAVAFLAGPALAGQRSAAVPKTALPTIVIGSTNFSEQYIVADLYGDVLKAAGYKVQVRPNLGTRQAVVPALEKGALDLEPDYAGTLLLYLNADAGTAANQISSATSALKTLLASHGATVLTPAPAIDTNVFAVTKATAAKYHLVDLSDLKPIASKLILGGPSECPQNATCELGLKKVYGLKFKSFVSTDESGPISVAALKTNRAEVVEFFSSDGNIVENHFVQLVDNKHLQAADQVIPVIRKSFATTGVVKALDSVSAKLTTTALSELNIKVNNDHESPATVAAAWLKSVKLG